MLFAQGLMMKTTVHEANGKDEDNMLLGLKDETKASFPHFWGPLQCPCNPCGAHVPTQGCKILQLSSSSSVHTTPSWQRTRLSLPLWSWTIGPDSWLRARLKDGWGSWTCIYLCSVGLAHTSGAWICACVFKGSILVLSNPQLPRWMVKWNYPLTPPQKRRKLYNSSKCYARAIILILYIALMLSRII